MEVDKEYLSIRKPGPSQSWKLPRVGLLAIAAFIVQVLRKIVDYVSKIWSMQIVSSNLALCFRKC